MNAWCWRSKNSQKIFKPLAMFKAEVHVASFHFFIYKSIIVQFAGQNKSQLGSSCCYLCRYEFGTTIGIKDRTNTFQILFCSHAGFQWAFTRCEITKNHYLSFKNCLLINVALVNSRFFIFSLLTLLIPAAGICCVENCLHVYFWLPFSDFRERVLIHTLWSFELCLLWQ